MSQVYFRSVKHAVAYNKYRATMPDAVIQKIMTYVKERMDSKQCLLVDVGCGTGLSTRPLAPFFNKVIGVDSSEAYLEEAKKNTTEDNVSFRLGSAEKIPMEDASVDVVSCMTAAHWFDLDKFFREVDRVLKPNGILAVSSVVHGYLIPGHEEEFHKIYHQLCWKDLANYYSPQLQLSKNLYKDVILPFSNQIRDTSILIEVSTTVDRFIERVKTSSGVAKCQEEDPQLAEESLGKFQSSLMKIIGSTAAPQETPIVVGKRYIVLLSQKTL